MLRKYNPSKLLLAIVLLAFLLRVLFALLGAELYYGGERYFLMGDSGGWMDSFTHLLYYGEYNALPVYENGPFFRLPGYSFLVGLFYVTNNFCWACAYDDIIFAQILLDVIALLMVYRITEKVTGNKRIGLGAAFLYAVYPFIIVWTPIIYAEATSVFFLILALYLIACTDTGWKYFFAGLAISVAVLCRVQLIFMVPAIALALVFASGHSLKNKVKHAAFFALGVILLYGMWPARNYINYGKPVFAQEIQDVERWQSDYRTYLRYIWLIQTDEEPQHSQIVNDLPVEWPSASYLNPGDSAKLNELVGLCRTCGGGFSWWRRVAGKVDQVVDTNCNEIIAARFNELIAQQNKDNFFHCWVKVPVNNFLKAVFKLKLSKPGNMAVQIVGYGMFLYRTIMILLGFLGLWLLFKRRLAGFVGMAVLLYLIFWYGFDCFYYRGMEMRFFLQGDILLLIFASYALMQFKKPREAKT